MCLLAQLTAASLEHVQYLASMGPSSCGFRKAQFLLKIILKRLDQAWLATSFASDATVAS